MVPFASRVGHLAAVASACGVISWVLAGVVEDSGVFLLEIPWPVDVAMLGIAAYVGYSGVVVRSYLRGQRPQLRGVQAARTLALAVSASMTGAVLTGVFSALVVMFAHDLLIEARRDKGLSALIALGCALVLMVVGVVVERWCRIDPPSSAAGDRERLPSSDSGPAWG